MFAQSVPYDGEVRDHEAARTRLARCVDRLAMERLQQFERELGRRMTPAETLPALGDVGTGSRGSRKVWFAETHSSAHAPRPPDRGIR